MGRGRRRTGNRCRVPWWFRPSILAIPLHIRWRTFGDSLGWTKRCSCGFYMGWESMMTTSSAKMDSSWLVGFTSIQKYTGALRCLTYEAPPDSQDDYLHMSVTSCQDSVYKFCGAVVAVFRPIYLRASKEEDTARIMTENVVRGFPKILTSIDCMQLGIEELTICWHELYKGHIGEYSVILKAVANRAIWIWHVFCMAGSHSNINMLRCSLVFARFSEGHALEVNYEINGRTYTMGYYLADKI
jgi:hypothetical protein